MSLILSGTDGLSDVDGSAATPAIRGTDANTGIFFPAADTIAFAEGGAEVARFDSSGNLGIGASPSYRLDVNATSFIAASVSTSYSGAGNIRIADASTTSASAPYIGSVGNNLTFGRLGTAEYARIDSSGNVGIGTSTVATNFRAQFLGTAGSNTSAASSGTTQAASAVLRLQAGGGFTGTLDIGQGGGTGSWLQSADTTNLATTYPLLLNPVGGDVIVGGTSTSSNESTYQGGGVFTSRRASSAGTTHANFLNGGSVVGSITSNTTTTFYNTTSDYRLKENATPVTTGLQTIAALNPVNFDWVSNRVADTGFLAHEFQAVIPNCVMGTKDAIDANGNPVYQQIDRSGAIPFLVAAIKEQQALITALTARITALETP
jgi:hypothetical protein